MSFKNLFGRSKSIANDAEGSEKSLSPKQIIAMKQKQEEEENKTKLRILNNDDDSDEEGDKVVDTEENLKSLDISNPSTPTISRQASTASDSNSDSPRSPNQIHLKLVVQPGVTKDGKHGWLFRDYDDSESMYLNPRYWVEIKQNKLFYFTSPPQQTTQGSFAVGFIDLTPSTTCSSIPQSTVSSHGNRYGFSVKDESIQLLLSTGSIDDRSEWIDVIKEAIGGVYHEIKYEECQDDSFQSPLASNFLSLEMPRKLGYLKKKSIEGKKFGFKNVKRRWFKLEAGELSYYSSEVMNADTFKKSFLLKDCSIDESKDKESPVNIVLNLPNGFSLLMEASTTSEASEWRNALKETLYVIAKSSVGLKKRRINLLYENCLTMHGSKKECNVKSGSILEVLTTSLKSHFLLKGIQNLTTVIEAMELEIFFPGDVILWQKSLGSSAYILESGTADVIKDGNRVASIGSGKLFGELALLHNVSRTATIRARTICRVWRLDRSSLRKVLSDAENATKNEKIALLRNIPLFGKLSDSMFSQVADLLRVATFHPGDKVIKQGEVGDCFYIIQSGTAAVTQNILGGSMVELVRLSPGKFFGELALISNEPRKATVTASEKLVCYTLDSATFNSVLGNLKDAEVESVGISILKKVKLLSGLSEKQLMVISKHLEKREYFDDEIIISQGEEGDRFYMISEGNVKVLVNHAEVAKLPPGSYFGEMALMNNDRRNATVVSIGDTVCLTLHRVQFVKLLGPLYEVLKAEIEKRKTESEDQGFFAMAKRLSQKITRSISTANQSDEKADSVKFRVPDFKHIGVIGHGTIATTMLVHHLPSNMVYALKTISKKSIEKLNYYDNIMREKECLKDCSHPFILSMYAELQDDKRIYFLSELLPGGDLWSLLYDPTHPASKILPKTVLGGIDLPAVNFYAGNIFVALSYLHDKDIVHRDLKPENIVIDRSGYLKIVDFGNSKYISPTETSNTMCGTPEYVSPEMLLARGHNRATDLWSFGILIFELLTRTTPFEHNDTIAIYQKIIGLEDTLKLALKPQWNAQAKSMVTKILVDKPSLRIGMLRRGYDDIWEHPFFNGESTLAYEERHLIPPYRPDIDDLFSCADTEAQLPHIPSYSGNLDFSKF